MTVSEAIGLSAAGIAAYAYVPQISHLVREHCSAGMSERAFRLWLTSSVLMTVHAVGIGSVVFVVLGTQQMASTAVVAALCRRYRDQACPSHRVDGPHRAPAGRPATISPAGGSCQSQWAIWGSQPRSHSETGGWKR